MMTKQVMRTFNIQTTIKSAWKEVHGSKITFWSVLLLLGIVTWMPTFIKQWLSLEEVGLIGIGIILSIGCTILRLILSWGLIYLGIQRAASLPIYFRMLGQVFSIRLFFRMIGLYLLKFLIYLPAIGLLLLPIFMHFFQYHRLDPMILQNSIMQDQIFIGLIDLAAVAFIIYLAMRMYIATQIVIAEKKGPLQAIKLSFQATRSCAWKLFGLSLINITIIIVSAIPFGLGLIWTLPYLFINYGVVYQQLLLNILQGRTSGSS